MIELFSTPSEQATLRLEQCNSRRAEAERAGLAVSISVKSCYRHEDVKSSIREETNGKCAYCESVVGHVYFGDVEHILPKSIFDDLMLDYDNLTYVCAVCNNNKSDYYSDDRPLINPYTDDPSQHLVGLGPLVWHNNASAMGRLAVGILKLNRPKLIEKRQEHIKLISELADRYSNEPDGPYKRVLAAELRDYASRGEFALIVRSFLKATHELEWQNL